MAICSRRIPVEYIILIDHSIALPHLVMPTIVLQCYGTIELLSYWAIGLYDYGSVVLLAYWAIGLLDYGTIWLVN